MSTTPICGIYSTISNNNTMMNPITPSQKSYFSTNEFYRMSLEQYLLLKSAFFKPQVDACTTSEAKRRMIIEFMSEYLNFAKQLMGRSSKNALLLIAEVIEKAFVIEFDYLRKRQSEELPRASPNRQLKLSMLSLPRMDLHVIQLFARLECLKLMYEYLMVAEKVPKGFNYRDRFESDLARHLDQIKVNANMALRDDDTENNQMTSENFADGNSRGPQSSQPQNLSPLDGLLLMLCKRLLSGCTCIEFYTFLNNFSIRNELSKPVRKFLRAEYETLSAKFASHPSQMNQQLNFSQSSQMISKQSMLQRKSASAIVASTTPRNQLRTPNNGEYSNNIPFEQQQQTQRNNRKTEYHQQRIMEVEDGDKVKTVEQFIIHSNSQSISDFTAINQLKNKASLLNPNQNNLESEKSQNLFQLATTSNEEQCQKPENLPILKSQTSEQDQKRQTRSSSDNCLKQSNSATSATAASATNAAAQKTASGNAQRATLTKPISSGRTMYSLLNKKVVRNSQSSSTLSNKPSSKNQSQTSQSRSQSTNPISNKQSTTTRSSSANVPATSSSNNNNINSSSSSSTTNNNNNNNNNILFEAASKLMQEQQDMKRQSQLKLISRESNVKNANSEPNPTATQAKKHKSPSKYKENQAINNGVSMAAAAAAAVTTTTASTIAPTTIAAQDKNIRKESLDRVAGEDENSMPLMFSWGHN